MNDKTKLKLSSYSDEKTHPTPDKDSRFYRKFKPEVHLSNPTVTYRKRKENLLDYSEFIDKS